MENVSLPLAVKQSNLDYYKYCFVPSCKNTSARNPDREFIVVPRNELKRKAWCEAVGYDKDQTIRRISYCCEDHLDLKNDLKNYENYKMFGGNKMLNKNVLPRFNLNTSKPIFSNVADICEENSTNISCELRNQMALSESSDSHSPAVENYFLTS